MLGIFPFIITLLSKYSPTSYFEYMSLTTVYRFKKGQLILFQNSYQLKDIFAIEL